jgi:hypothetical protein
MALQQQQQQHQLSFNRPRRERQKLHKRQRRTAPIVPVAGDSTLNVAGTMPAATVAATCSVNQCQAVTTAQPVAADLTAD